MYGAGRGKTTLVDIGLLIEGEMKDEVVEIEDLTLKGGGNSGLSANWGMNVIMRGCTVEDCQENGLIAWKADVSCVDLQVVGCGMSGVFAYGTSIHGNVTKGDSMNYGLNAIRRTVDCNSSEPKIKLVAPLTKEQISTNNGGGGNWNGDKSYIPESDHVTIEQVSK